MAKKNLIEENTSVESISVTHLTYLQQYWKHHFCGTGRCLLLFFVLVTSVPGTSCSDNLYCITPLTISSNITAHCPSYCQCTHSHVYCNGSLAHVLNGTLNRTDIFSSIQNKQIDLLDLSGNGIEQIVDGFFKLLNIRTCRLILSYNKLSEIRGPELEGIYTDNLDLSHNVIDRISPTAFNGQSYTIRSVLDLSYNKMTYFEPWPYTDRNIRIIGLQHNFINTFRNSLNLTIVDIMEKQTADGVKYHCSTDLMYNNFSVWVMDDLRRVYHWDADKITLDTMKLYSMALSFSHNPWICDCGFYKLRSLLRQTFYSPDIRWPNCAMPPHLRGVDILDVPLEELVCPVLQDCPVSCVCESVPVHSYTRVNCSGGGLTSLPHHMPSGPLFINLSQNQITSFPFRTYLKQVQVLDLSQNRLTTLDGDAVRELKSIKSPGMDLRSNVLTTLPKEIQVVKFSDVNVDHDSLKCSCDLTWVSDWIDVSSEDPANQRSVCYLSDGSTILLADMAEALDCTTDIVVPVAVGVTVIVAVVIFIAVTCRIWGKKKLPFVMYLMRQRRIQPEQHDDENGQHVDFDVYLSFDNDDMEIVLWVKNVLMENLEKVDPVFRVCCPLRDFDVGVSQADEILKNIDSSRRFVSVVSRNYFHHRQWTAYEYDSAIHKYKDGDCNMIMILYNDIDVELVQCEAAKPILIRKAYLTRNQYLFWQKFRYFIVSGLKTT